MGPPIERRCQMSNPLGIGVIKCNPPKFINFRPAEVWCKKMLDQLINDCHVMTRAELILSKRGYWGHWTFTMEGSFFWREFPTQRKRRSRTEFRWKMIICNQNDSKETTKREPWNFFFERTLDSQTTCVWRNSFHIFFFFEGGGGALL